MTQARPDAHREKIVVPIIPTWKRLSRDFSPIDNATSRRLKPVSSKAT